MTNVSRSSLLALVAIGIVSSAALLGNAATMPSIPTWYAGLHKPIFNPPNWIFGPVWTVLYLALAFALWRILRLEGEQPERKPAILIFAVQMILNPLWSIVFFYFHAPSLALGFVIGLEISVLMMIRAFNRIDPVAARLQWPYAAWVAFAAVLNAAIVVLN